MVLSGSTHLLSTWKCCFSTWVLIWHSNLKRGILFQSPLFNFPCPCARIFLYFNPSRACSPRVICSPNCLPGCPSPCLWHIPPQPPPSSSGGWNKGKNFCLTVTRGQVKNDVDVKGEERQKYCRKRGAESNCREVSKAISLATRLVLWWAPGSAWGSSEQEQASVCFSPLSYPLISIFILFM